MKKTNKPWVSNRSLAFQFRRNRFPMAAVPALERSPKKMKRTYIRAAAWLALLAVFVVSAYTALMLWKLRPQQFILSAEPFALREDSKALSLARIAMRDAGYGTKDFVANSLSYDNTFPDIRRYNFSASPGMPTHPGFYVQLEQEGADVQVMIRRRK